MVLAIQVTYFWKQSMESGMALFTLSFQREQGRMVGDSRKREEEVKHEDSLLAKHLIFGKSGYVNIHTHTKTS